jgi:hypothetical protein
MHPIPMHLTPRFLIKRHLLKRKQMRLSTVRRLNVLKAEHPDVTVLFNTFIDLAVSHYYNYIFNDGGTFNFQEEKFLRILEGKNFRILEFIFFLIKNLRRLLCNKINLNDIGLRNELLKSILINTEYKKEKHQKNDDFEINLYPRKMR